jgi:hypothetical protein
VEQEIWRWLWRKIAFWNPSKKIKHVCMMHMLVPAELQSHTPIEAQLQQSRSWEGKLKSVKGYVQLEMQEMRQELGKVKSILTRLTDKLEQHDQRPATSLAGAGASSN